MQTRRFQTIRGPRHVFPYRFAGRYVHSCTRFPRPSVRIVWHTKCRRSVYNKVHCSRCPLLFSLFVFLFFALTFSDPQEVCRSTAADIRVHWFLSSLRVMTTPPAPSFPSATIRTNAPSKFYGEKNRAEFVRKSFTIRDRLCLVLSIVLIIWEKTTRSLSIHGVYTIHSHLLSGKPTKRQGVGNDAESYGNTNNKTLRTRNGNNDAKQPAQYDTVETIVGNVSFYEFDSSSFSI